MLCLPDEILREILSYIDPGEAWGLESLCDIAATHSRLLDPARASLHESFTFALERRGELGTRTWSESTPEEKCDDVMWFLSWKPSFIAESDRIWGGDNRSNGSYVRNLTVWLDWEDWQENQPPFQLVAGLVEACSDMVEFTMHVLWLEGVPPSVLQPICDALRCHTRIRTVRFTHSKYTPTFTPGWMSRLLSSLPPTVKNLSLDFEWADDTLDRSLALQDGSLRRISSLEISDVGSYIGTENDAGDFQLLIEPILAAVVLESYSLVNMHHSAVDFLLRMLDKYQTHCHRVRISGCDVLMAIPPPAFKGLVHITHLTISSPSRTSEESSQASSTPYFASLPANLKHLKLLALPCGSHLGNPCLSVNLLLLLQNKTWLPKLQELQITFSSASDYRCVPDLSDSTRAAAQQACIDRGIAIVNPDKFWVLGKVGSRVRSASDSDSK